MIKVFIKKNIFLIIIFAAISFFCSSFIYIIENGIKTSSADNNFLSVDSVNFKIDTKDKERLKNHLTDINDNYTLIRRDRSAFFNEVIGVLGNSKKKSYYDDKIYLNLNYMTSKDKSEIKGDYAVDSALNSENIYGEIKKAYKNDNVNVVKSPPSYVSSSSEAINTYYKYDIENMIKMLIPIIINIFLITTYWIKKRTKEIAIKRAFGASRLRVSASILLELVLVSILSFILGYLLYLLISFIKDRYLHFYIETVLSVFIITVLSGILSSAVPIIKACLVQPAEMMR